jgi:hypothetical protein
MQNYLQRLFLLILGISTQNFIMADAKATEVEIVKDIISMHQSYARAQLGRDISLKILETDEPPNANASFQGPNRGPLITYYSSLLYLNQDDDVITVVCHELGHLIGSRAAGSAHGLFAIESESDYFAGQCAVRYYTSIRNYSLSQAQTAAGDGAQKSFSRLYKKRINPNEARFQVYDGINQSYSSPPCRVLSVIHGAMDWNRPKCWYNP